MQSKTCTFAYPNTYGHECGGIARWAASMPSEHTTDGIFWARRCDKCRDEKGGENAGLRDWQAFDPAKHSNQWRK